MKTNFKTFVLLAIFSVTSLDFFAAAPTNINDYTTNGIIKKDEGYDLNLKCTYIAGKENSLTGSSYIGVTLISPSGVKRHVTFKSGIYAYYNSSTHWSYGKWKKSGGYVYFDLQTVESGIWTLINIQTNAGEWYYYNKNIHTITTTSNNEDWGTASGGGSYVEGESVTLTATASDCQHFVRWNDGNTDNPREITITGNATYTAEFETTQYTITFKNDDGTVLQSSVVNCGEMPSYTGETPVKNPTDEYTYTFDSWSPSIEPASKDETYTTVYTATQNGGGGSGSSGSGELCSAPAHVLYDWILMLDVRQLQTLGYEFEEQNVTWYRISDNGTNVAVGKGFYFTMDQPLLKTGNYYAKIELPYQHNNVPCNDGILTTKVFYFPDSGYNSIKTAPSVVRSGDNVQLINLPNENVTIRVYNTMGVAISTNTTSGNETFKLTSTSNEGYYVVYIETSQGTQILKYIVVK